MRYLMKLSRLFVFVVLGFIVYSNVKTVISGNSRKSSVESNFISEQAIWHREHILPQQEKDVPRSNETTVVTAYFDIGSFRKGGKSNIFSKEMYFNWAKIFQFMENPLVAYTDTTEFHDFMTSLRHGKENRTRVNLISRNSSWAFRNEEKIKQIISTPGYPKHYPNTVVSAYSCSQHAKYDVIERAARADIFRTRYFAWVDIGYFRNRKSDLPFQLVKLNDFNDQLISMNQIFNVNKNRNATDIFKGNKVWIGGGLFVGERGRILMFAKQFRKAVDIYLSYELVNTDQQVLYAMFSDKGRHLLKPEVDLQVYKLPGWFSLGFSMLREINFSRTDIGQIKIYD